MHCKGTHKEQGKKPWYRKRKPFVDLEPSCVFTMSEEGLQIGRANENASYFNITLWRTPDKDGYISFGVGFGPDPTENARFESALFTATFGNDDGKNQNLKILDLMPKDERGASTSATWGKSSTSSLGMSVGYNGASLSGTGSLAKNVEFTRETASRVTGNGMYTPTATWTFKEDVGPAGQHGLGAQYDLHVCLSSADYRIWMRFWAKAVLIYGKGKRVTLEIGSSDKPCMRWLDLGGSISAPG
jgi:hypothetical protein